MPILFDEHRGALSLHTDNSIYQIDEDRYLLHLYIRPKGLLPGVCCRIEETGLAAFA